MKESRAEFFLKGKKLIYHKLEDSLTYSDIIDKAEVDVNNDKEINLFDILALKNLIEEGVDPKSDQFLKADLNKDQSLNDQDIEMLIDKILK